MLPGVAFGCEGVHKSIANPALYFRRLLPIILLLTEFMARPLAVVAIVLAVLAAVRGQPNELVLLPTKPMPAVLIP
ncbi:hypothetical protein [Bradyrhizobium tropiciagri]|uniref:hypothetical protein n=1 Tax=Bradyrhizobium tropiciagri TaxID=312253 RepID=UPI001009971D|nr:hypothetical protein [Bradyrhizobium tropiciagri]